MPSHAPDPENPTTTPAPTPGNPRLQRLILRVAAASSLLALPAVLLPRLAAEEFSWFMGLGRPEVTPLLAYLAGGGAYVYLAAGLLLWGISLDVARHRPLVILSAWIFLVGGPAFLWIDSRAGLPGWWVALDGLSCLVFGAALLWACHRGGASCDQIVHGSSLAA